MKVIFCVLLGGMLWGCSSGNFSGESVHARKAAGTSTIKEVGTASSDAVAESPSPGAVQTATPAPAEKSQAKSCNSGEYVSGINADGSIQCAALPAATTSTVIQTTEVQQVVAQPNPPPPAPSCYMETTRWSYGRCKETCRNGGTQSGECTLISSTCSAAYKTGQCYDGSGSRMCCK
jgi:hypothetical protein